MLETVLGFCVSSGDRDRINWLILGEQCSCEASSPRTHLITHQSETGHPLWSLMCHICVWFPKAKRAGRVFHVPSSVCSFPHPCAHQGLHLDSCSGYQFPKFPASLASLLSLAVTTKAEKLLKPDFSVCFLHIKVVQLPAGGCSKCAGESQTDAFSSKRWVQQILTADLINVFISHCNYLII